MKLSDMKMSKAGIKKAIAFSTVEKLKNIICLPIISSLALKVAEIIGHQQLEMLVRGTSMLRKVSVSYPFYCGRNVIIRNAERIEMGSHVTLFDSVFIDAGNGVSIGSHTHIDVFTSIYGYGGVQIGEKCAIAAGVRIYSQTNQYKAEREKPVIYQPVHHAMVCIGNDVWIGANAVILPGVTIGDHSVIGACSLVNRDVPSGSVVAGIPARIIGSRY
ncbi:acyltransferase [Candidatus Solincola sp.]